MAFRLYSHQRKAVDQLRVGKILYGGVGSGKTLTALSYYFENHFDRPLYVITTAKKRDSKDWDDEAEILGVKPIVDSWNNIKKYKDIKDAFFIFDEQRVVGYSAWSRTFIKISKANPWILLSATPGDTWMDYIPVFIANGFYKHKTDFIEQHVEYDRFVSYPKVKKYHNEGKLIKNRDAILMPMPMDRHTTRHRQLIYSKYDKAKYSAVMDKRWNIWEEKPIENTSELLHCVRKVVATDPDRIWNAKVIMDMTDRLIVYYNYNYELDILKNLAIELGKDFYQWNGHAHEEIPDQDQWLYFVQYTAGAEGWNCIETNTVLFYSLNYSFRIMEQTEGRIDRLNTPFKDLEYYILTSNSRIDQDVYKAVVKKKQFNRNAWVRKIGVRF